MSVEYKTIEMKVRLQVTSNPNETKIKIKKVWAKKEDGGDYERVDGAPWEEDGVNPGGGVELVCDEAKGCCYIPGLPWCIWCF